MNKLKDLCLNGFQLKLIGWACTLCGVAAILFFPMTSMGILKVILTYIGYIALPIFAFLLVEGFALTENLSRYALLLGICALVTEPFYDFVCTGHWLDTASGSGQNIFFAMLLGLLQLRFVHYMGTGSLVRKIACGSMVFATALWTTYLNIPYGFYFEMMVGIFYLLHDNEKWMFWITGVISAFSMGTPALGILAILAYDGERGSYNKYLFYVAYPLIWIVTALIRLLV